MGMPDGETRRAFLGLFYAIMREEDDIGDGDRPLPEGATSAAEFLKNDIVFVHTSWHEETQQEPKTHTQRLLAHCLALAEEFGEDFRGEAISIISSILFDAERRRQRMLYPQRELDENYDMLDVVGTVRGCLKVAKEPLSNEPHLRNLAQAVRIQYTLRDFVADIEANLVNISQEDAQRFGIVPADLDEGLAHPGIRAWYEEQLACGLNLLDRHRTNVHSLGLKTTTQITLWIGYEREAREFFLKELNRINGMHVSALNRTAIRTPVAMIQTMTQARIYAMQHGKALGLQPEERRTFAGKVTNLALCYRGLVPKQSFQTTHRATQAALASAAYDVATDWKGFAPTSIEELLRIVNTAPPEAQKIVVDLLEKDHQNTLAHDGLERGTMALEYIAMVMGIREDLTKTNIPLNALGELLQIADDVMDLEEDTDAHQTNCLLTPRRTSHLQRFVDANLHQLFSPKTVLGQVLVQTRLKALVLLRKDALEQH
ncbi:hypothetical protein COU80_05215 [Candidatus Peregrinibacteria bacterium CG10_big_fil_rev_8_21_14_0_10_55_24]|nr:MAG: hypothetical protein COU80_05215 [Candidatus Peregrinibacteria bacterium CG10_big_fil_rev_8_21_14_0_10_55_24]